MAVSFRPSKSMRPVFRSSFRLRLGCQGLSPPVRRHPFVATRSSQQFSVFGLMHELTATRVSSSGGSSSVVACMWVSAYGFCTRNLQAVGSVVAAVVVAVVVVIIAPAGALPGAVDALPPRRPWRTRRPQLAFLPCLLIASLSCY